MSQVRTAHALNPGQNQVDPTSGGVGKAQRETFIPLNSDASAVQVVSGGASANETPVSIRAAAVLSASYVASTAVDMSYYNRVYFHMAVTVAEAVTATFKIQYSADNSTWDDFQMDSYAAPSGGEVLATGNTWTKQLSLASTGNYWGECFDKRAKYIRVAVKSGGVTTGKVSITAQRFNV